MKSRGFFEGISIDLFLAGTRYSSPKLSPDGNFLTYIIISDSGSSDLALYNMQKRTSQQLTFNKQISAGTAYGGGTFCWTSDGKEIIFTSKGKLYKISKNGGIPDKIQNFDHAFEPYEMDDTIIFSVEHEDTMSLAICTGDSWPQRIRLDENFIYDARLHPHTKDIVVHGWSFPNMSWNESRIILLNESKGYEATTISKTEKVATSQPTFSPDGNWIAFHCDASGWLNLWVAKADGTEVRQLVKAEEEHAYSTWTTGEYDYAWSPDTLHIIYMKNRKGFMSLSLVEIETGKITDLRAKEGRYRYLSCKKPFQLVCLFSDHQTPDEIQLITYQMNGECKIETLQQSGVKIPESFKNMMPKPKEITLPTSDNKNTHVLFYSLPDKNGEISNCPTLFYIHGGPTGMVTNMFKLDIMYWVAKGWAICAVNHRGSIGYGREYREILNENWGIYDVSDTFDTFNELKNKKLIDPDRSAIIGGSAGGYTTLMFLAKHPGVMKAGVNLFGVADLFGLSDETHFLESQYDTTLIGKLPEASPKFFERSPIFIADKIKDPLLILQGEDDPVVLKNQSDAIAKAVTGEVEYKIYKGEGHGFRKTENLLDMYTRINKFLKKHVLFKR